MSKKKIILFSTLAVVVVVVVLMLNVGSGGSDEIEVQIAKVERNTVVQTVTASGRIQPKTQVKISADVAAKITRLQIKEGDWVEKSQFLVELDSERFIAAVERTEASLRSNKSNAELAKQNMLKAQKDFERTKQLFARSLESQATLDQNNAAYQVEKARYQSALDQVAQSEAILKQARDDLSKTKIYAPMASKRSSICSGRNFLRISERRLHSAAKSRAPILILTQLKPSFTLLKTCSNISFLSAMTIKPFVGIVCFPFVKSPSKSRRLPPFSKSIKAASSPNLIAGQLVKSRSDGFVP